MNKIINKDVGVINNKKARLWILLIFVIAATIRFYHIDIPFLEPFNNMSRQSMCASVTRNLYERGFRLFYPEIDENGSGPSLYNVELPIHSFLMALAYKLFGGVREGVARSVSVIFSLGYLWIFYDLVRRLSSRLVATGALLFLSISPMVVALSRSIQPDIAMLFFATASIYCFFLYSRNDRKSIFLWISVLSLTLAALTRVFALCHLLLIFYLAWKKDGLKLFKNYLYYFFILPIVIAFCWYGYMWISGNQQDLAYSPYHYSSATENLPLIELFYPKNLILPVKAIFLHLFTPFGVVLFLIGLFRKQEGKDFFVALLISSIFYLLIVWRTAVVHPYYFLPLSAPGAFFIASGVVVIYQKIHQKKIWQIALISILLPFFLFYFYYYYRLIYYVPKERLSVVEVGKMTDRLIPSNAIVVAAYGSSPIQVYYCHRRGWTFELSNGSQQELIDRLKSLQDKGASYFVTTEVDLLKEKSDFLRYLERGKIIKQTKDYQIIKLEGA